VVVGLETTGSDPARDELLALRARRLGPEGSGEDLELDGEGLGDEAGWQELLAFVDGRPVLVAEASEVEGWRASQAPGVEALARLTGLGEVAALLFPGRLARRPGELVVELLGEDAPPAPGPDELFAALRELRRRFLELGNEAVHALTVSLATAWSRLHVAEPEAAGRLGRVLHLLQAGELWSEEGAAGAGLRIESDAFETEYLSVLLDETRPRWQREAEAWRPLDPLPPRMDGPQPWTKEDAERLDAVFREHLPAQLTEIRGEATGGEYRASQHAVAREVGGNFGHQGEPETRLFLVHAPTGTGKTLAYLVPALLWATRHGLRVGIATYTRALQEQAVDRELPRALELLRRAGWDAPARVSMLKGRENSLCWRTFKLHVPRHEASGEAWLAFSQLLAFALGDATGDLDRLPRRPPLELESGRAYRAALGDLLRQVRARTACCRLQDDRESCAAEVARFRAERSHLVITNHSFALARQDFFRHLVFDECEHLHDQAHAAWSHQVALSSIEALLDRLDRSGRSGGRSLLERIARRLAEGTKSWETLAEVRARLEALRVILGELRLEVGAFDEWRKARGREREERDEHSLLREYAAGEAGAQLVAARSRFTRLGGQLDERLAELVERLEQLAIGRLGRLRRSIDLARTELDEFLKAVTAWLPLQEGRPAFQSRTFNDVEIDSRGELVLSARVLLPNEYLGRFYYPQLASATFLSATTHLGGGFDAASAYLGLDHALAAEEGEPEHPCLLRTFRAPEVFDYSRVLVCVPRDAPAVSRDKEAYLAYVRDFVAELGERTRGRLLALFTNAEDVRRVGQRLEGHFRARRIGFWYQNMPGIGKEEMSELFRSREDSVLLGVDTFWYGADFPGPTLEHLVVARLPYGVPDRYHHAQCAALGTGEQRRQIYLPRALAKFRQGFGRLMRRVDDQGCVYILDQRVVDPRHRHFLRELPLAGPGKEGKGLARLVRGDRERCLSQAMIHLGLAPPAEALTVLEPEGPPIERFEPVHDGESEEEAAPADIDLEDLPF